MSPQLKAELAAYADGQRAVLRMLRRCIERGTCSAMTGTAALELVAAALDASVREVDTAKGGRS